MFSSAPEFTSTGFFENIKNNMKHSLVQCETVRRFGPHCRILTSKLSKDIAQSVLSIDSTTERACQGFISSLYFDLIETQIKITMAKQLYNCFGKDRKASRLKCLRNSDDKKKCTVIFIYSFRT